MQKNPQTDLATRIAGPLAILVVAELFLLRLGTRTLIHIPGLEKYETPIRWLAEVGRFAYFAAVVFLIALLIALTVRRFRRSGPFAVMGALAALGFLVTALAGRLEWIQPGVVGWVGMTALVMALVGAASRGRRALPLAFFTAGAVAAGWSALAQGRGGGLSGGQVDALLIVSEIMVLGFALTAPLLLERRPSRRAMLVGLGVAVPTALVAAASSSTVSILALWSFGTPGWLPGIAYALALGAVGMVLWSAFESGERQMAVGLVLLTGGGVGMISTYQTGLALAALLVLGDALQPSRVSSAHRLHRTSPETSVATQVPAPSSLIRLSM